MTKSGWFGESKRHSIAAQKGRHKTHHGNVYKSESVGHGPIRVETGEYRYSHGHEPSRDYGMWAFLVGDKEVFISGTYTDAKRDAIKIAKKRGIRVIDVMP
jgi:hypothetical protein